MSARSVRKNSYLAPTLVNTCKSIRGTTCNFGAQLVTSLTNTRLVYASIVISLIQTKWKMWRWM